MRLLALCFTLFCMACSSAQVNQTQPTAQTTADGIRIIIGYAEANDPSDPGLIESLEQTLAAQITFLNALGGNAAVYLCTTNSTADEFTLALNRLSERADIRYAERDQKYSTTPGSAITY